MTQWQISRETKPGSGTFKPVEVFEGDQMASLMRAMQLQAGVNGSYMLDPYTAPAEPIQADPVASATTTPASP